MPKRGRKSAAELTISPVVPLSSVPRPDAPYDLTDEQTREWWGIVNRLPADWFPKETHPLLAQYCRHIVSSRRVAQLVQEAEKAQPFDVETYDKLLKMQEREGRAIASLATKMRLSQQTTYDKSKRKPLSGKKPWQSANEAD